MLNVQRPNTSLNCSEKFDWSEFLAHGYFLGSPALNKVWCVYGDLTAHSECAQREQNAQTILENTPDFLSDRTFCFYRNDFEGSIQKPWISSQHCYEFKIDDFFSQIKNFKSSAPNVRWHTEKNKKNRQIYQDIFEKIKNAIDASLIQKAVPFYREQGECELTQDHLIHFFKCLLPLKQNSELFFYGVWNLKQGKLQFGASPELLFVQDENILETIALAGTSISPKTEFSDIKMQSEHNYVVQDLHERLKKYGHVTLHDTIIVPFQNFFHQKTKFIVDCQNKDYKFEDFLDSVYPSAAIGAYPRAKGLEFLKQLEEEHGQKRGFFAAPIGIQYSVNAQRSGHFKLCVSTIRGIECDAGKIFITAGGGVVAQSMFSNEWEEINLKIKSIKSIYQLID